MAQWMLAGNPIAWSGYRFRDLGLQWLDC